MPPRRSAEPRCHRCQQQLLPGVAHKCHNGKQLERWQFWVGIGILLAGWIFQAGISYRGQQDLKEQLQEVKARLERLEDLYFKP